MTNATTTSPFIEHAPAGDGSVHPYAERIQRLSTECGCRAGAIALFAAAALFVIYEVGAGAALGPRLGWVWGVPIVFGASIAGKLAGIAAARAQLRLLYRRIGAPYRRR